MFQVQELAHSTAITMVSSMEPHAIIMVNSMNWRTITMVNEYVLTGYSSPTREFSWPNTCEGTRASFPPESFESAQRSRGRRAFVQTQVAPDVQKSNSHQLQTHAMEKHNRSIDFS